MSSNPLLSRSSLPYQLPDFEAIRDEHFLPAVKEALDRHRAEIAAIVENPEPPTWENTLDAWEASGQDLDRVVGVFYNLVGPDGTPERLEIEAEFSPLVSAYSDDIWLNRALYERVAAVVPPTVDDGLSEEEAEENRVLIETILREFRRHGIELDEESQQEIRAINMRLSELMTKFGSNLLADTQRRAIAVDEFTDLSGLSPEDQAALRASGFIPLNLPTVQPILENLTNRGLAKRIHEESISRGVGSGDNAGEDNREILLEIVELRARRAELLGYSSHAEYIVETETADSVDEVLRFLRDLAPAAQANYEAELKLASELAGYVVQPWERPRWAAQVCERDYELDTDSVRPYFPLSRVRDGAFAVAREMYGLELKARPDLKGYAPGVDVWEVFDLETDEGIGLFLTDYYDRPTKRGGAWMSEFVGQSTLLGRKPVIVNVMAISPTSDGSDPLLTLDQVTTLFHEFGHALHGLLSNVRYPRLAGTNVPRDFVEFPSQINENWAFLPSVVTRYARHCETGDMIPAALVEKIGRAAKAGQGFSTAEYLAACVIDMAWHTLTAEQARELRAQGVGIVKQFESEALRKAGLDIEPRYSSTYFNHIFAGGYSAGYWSYLWAEALDADGFETLRKGPAQGMRFRKLILSRGATIDYGKAFEEFTGHTRSVKALLQRRGLSGVID